MTQGTVVSYSNRMRTGIIRARDGRRFMFGRTEWDGNGEPSAGAEVMFDEHLGTLASNVRRGDF